MRLAVSLLACAIAAAQPSPVRQRLAAIAPRMQAMVDDRTIPGAAWFVAQRGEILAHHAVGWQDLDARRPMRPITAAAQPGPGGPHRPIALYQILTHTSGMESDPPPCPCAPCPAPVELRQHGDRHHAAHQPRIALLYRRDNGKLVLPGANVLGGDPTAFRNGARYPAPEFGLYSTAADIAAFYQMMLDGGVYKGRRLLSRSTVEVMTALRSPVRILMRRPPQPVEQLLVEEPELPWVVEIRKMTAIRAAVRRGEHPADTQPKVGTRKDRAKQTVLAVIFDVPEILVFHASLTNSSSVIMPRRPSGKTAFQSARL